MPNEDAHLCPQSDADLHHEVLRSAPAGQGPHPVRAPRLTVRHAAEKSATRHAARGTRMRTRKRGAVPGGGEELAESASSFHRHFV